MKKLLYLSDKLLKHTFMNTAKVEIVSVPFVMIPFMTRKGYKIWINPNHLSFIKENEGKTCVLINSEWIELEKSLEDFFIEIRDFKGNL